MIVMAGGTGGHIYVALAVADALRSKGVSVSWLGVRNGMEDEIAKNSGYEFDSISIQKVWGAGLARWLMLPFRLTFAVLQSMVVIVRRRPDAVLGVGGYVCAPGGLASWLLRRPLLIHESNAVPGLANRLLAGISSRVLTGFPDTSLSRHPIHVGNPVRGDIICVDEKVFDAAADSNRQLRLLVLGGSQGARALNEHVPASIAGLEPALRPEVLHQAGSGNAKSVEHTYAELGIGARVTEFIEDMARVYAWSDVAISRAGAMTLAELAATRTPSILIPYPHAAQNHQKKNAEYYARRECAYLVEESDSLSEQIEKRLRDFANCRSRLARMSKHLGELAAVDAIDTIVEHCMQEMNA